MLSNGDEVVAVVMVYSKSLLILREEEFFCNGYGLSDFKFSILILACGNEKRVVPSAYIKHDVLIGRLDGRWFMVYIYISRRKVAPE